MYLLNNLTGLGAVIQAESMELVPSLNNPEMNPKSEANSSSINNKILTDILVEFCYSILLQFSFEELSQVSSDTFSKGSKSWLSVWSGGASIHHVFSK